MQPFFEKKAFGKVARPCLSTFAYFWYARPSIVWATMDGTNAFWFAKESNMMSLVLLTASVISSSDGVNRDAYEKIHIGMTKMEVLQILRRPSVNDQKRFLPSFLWPREKFDLFEFSFSSLASCSEPDLEVWRSGQVKIGLRFGDDGRVVGKRMQWRGN